jgi:hypothetical protein
MTVAAGTGSTLMGGVSLAPGNVDQFTVAIDPDTQNEEIVFITQVSTDTFTISRGEASTGNISHTGGATVRHVLTSDDLTFYTTGVATADGAVQKSVATAKGDLLVATASGVIARQGVGTNGQVLTADSTLTNGIKWSSVSATPRIGQVVTATTTNITTTTSAGTVDVSGLAVTITPTSATSKILITTSFNTTCGTGGTSFFLGLYSLLRSSTSLTSGFVGGYYPSGGGVNTVAYDVAGVSYVDSPATTSATTYKVQINNLWGNNVTVNSGGYSMQITAMEVLV